MSKWTDEMETVLTQLAGKEVCKIYFKDDHVEDTIIFEFSDGSKFKIEYDWIYGFEINGKSFGYE